MLYAKEHYKHEWCLKKAKSLRESGRFDKVRVGNTIKENGEKYSKVYVYGGEVNE